MRLLSPTEARSKKKQENDSLVEKSAYLRGYMEKITKKLNSIKDDYEPDKLLKLKEFEQFCFDQQSKKAEVLEELAGWQRLVEQTKEKYYALVAKQDELDERTYRIGEENKKLDLREKFVLDLEQKWQAKQ